jgi:hypothetical protein
LFDGSRIAAIGLNLTKKKILRYGELLFRELSNRFAAVRPASPPLYLFRLCQAGDKKKSRFALQMN